MLLQLAPINTAGTNSSDHNAPKLAEDEILRLPVCDEMVELYFDLFHNKQQILFHRQAFLSQLSKNQIADYILLGIVALVARFSKHDYFQDTSPHERAKHYLTRALVLFNNRAESVSIQTLQGSILLSFVCSVEKQSDQSSLLAAQATCMVQLLGLPERPADFAVERETNIRLFWQAWMMDIWNSARDGRPRQLTATQDYSKPSVEDAFEDLDLEVKMIPGSHMCTFRHRGIWSEVVELTETLAEVMQVIKTWVEQPYGSIQAAVRIQQLASQLNDWNRNLPEGLQNTLENREQFRILGRGREFAVLHLIFHYQCLILYFPYLAKHSDTDVGSAATKPFDEPSREYADYCKAHARALSELMWTTNTTSGMECLWSPVNGHLLVVASTVHLYSLLFDQSPTGVPHSKTLLEQNFVMLLQLQKYWPTLKCSLIRLQAIHKACERGYGLRIFEMDAWMLDFLSNYNCDVTERFAAMDPTEHTVEMFDEIPWAIGLEWSDITAKALDIGSELNASLTFN